MSKFRRIVAQLASGTLLSQAIVLLAMPFLTRFIAPASFGGLALFSSIYAVLSGIFTLKYEQSILLPQEKENAKLLTVLTVALSFCFSMVLLFVLGYCIYRKLIDYYWLCLPVCTFMAAIHSSSQQWSARMSNYRAYSTSLVLGSIVNSLTCVFLAEISGDSIGALVIGMMLGLLTSVAYVLFSNGIQIITDSKSMWSECRRVFRQGLIYREFPINVLPTSLAIGAASYAPPLIISAVYSASDTGHYAVATKFVLLPSIMLGVAISEAFRAEFMERIRVNGSIDIFTRALIKRIFIFGVPLAILMALVAPFAFHLVFGEKYEYSGILVRYLVTGILGMFISQSLQCIFIGLRRSRIGLVLQGCMSIVPLALLYICSFALQFKYALMIYSSSVFLISLVIIGSALKLTRVYDLKLSRN
jgi:O-antigen/teichoic acid export membrane protein